MKTALFQKPISGHVLMSCETRCITSMAMPQIAAEESDFIDDQHPQLIRQHLSKVTQESQALLEQIERS